MGNSKSKEFTHRLSKIDISLLVNDAGPKSLVEINEKDSIQSAIALATKHNLQAIALFDSNTMEYSGIVSLYDIFRFVVMSKGWDISKAEGIEADDQSKNRFNKVIATFQDCLSSPVSLALRPDYKDVPLLTMKTDVTTLVKAFILHDFHRLIVHDDVAKMVNESDTVKFITNELNAEFEELYGKFPLSSLNNVLKMRRHHGENAVEIAHKNVRSHCCKLMSTATITCFRTLYLRNVFAIPIIDVNGVLVDTIGRLDIKAVFDGTCSFQDLLLPVTEYLAKARKGVNKSLYTVAREDSVHEVLRILVEHRLHIVWIVDTDHKPVGCITLSDMLSLMVFKAVKEE